MIKITNIEIALIQDDLKHNDTIIQIANSLDILDESMRNVFDHTKKSIWRTRQCLHAIEKRSSVVCANIEKLKNIQKSVTIVSKSKYPYPYNGNYSVHIQHEHVTPMYKCPLLLYDKTEINTRDIDNKLKFYHVKTNNMLHKNVELVCEESLGKLPAPIDSVMSSILFNTSDNVYEKYIIVHPGQVIARKPITKKHDHTEQVKMEDAPKSLSEADDILARKHTFTYSPSLDTIPVIELPVDLPDLIGFAHDFRYTGDNNIDDQLPVSIITKGDTMNTEDNNVCPDDLSTPKLSTYSTSPPLPPPPPPLPPSSNSPPATSLHANLMQAIRTAGGTRKAKLRCVDATPESDNNMIVAPPSGDLMSDLAAKLQLRRKGISGSHNQMNENSTSSGNLMDKLLHNIPPPLAAGSSESDHDDTDTEPDWDD